jgi:hypothetical protein
VGTKVEPIKSDVEVEEFKTAARKIQTFLRDKGIYVGAVDGDFGPGSRKALEDYIRNK